MTPTKYHVLYGDRPSGTSLSQHQMETQERTMTDGHFVGSE